MDYSYINEKYDFDENSLAEYGFVAQNGCFLLKKELSGLGLTAEICIDREHFTAEVYDADTGELYAPFNAAVSSGVFVSMVRECVERLVDDIVSGCFNSTSLREWVLDYAKCRAHSTVEFPWEKSPNYFTMKGENGKWYGIVMGVPQKYLFGESERTIDIINIKLPPEKIDELVDNKTFFRAWHMNKRLWITVVLDGKISVDTLQELIEESYSLVNKRKKGK